MRLFLDLSCWKAGDPVCDFFNSIVLLTDTPTFEAAEQSFKPVDNEKLATNAKKELPSTKIDYPVGGQLLER